MGNPLNKQEAEIERRQLALANSKQPSNLFANRQEAARAELERLERIGAERPYSPKS